MKNTILYRWKLNDSGKLEKTAIRDFVPHYSYYKYKRNGTTCFVSNSKLDRYVSGQVYSFIDYKDSEVYSMILNELTGKEKELKAKLDKVSNIIKEVNKHYEESNT